MAKREELRKEVFRVIAQTYADNVGVPVESFTEETQPDKEYDVTSTMIIHVVLALQEKFEVQVNFMPFRRQKTIGAMVDFVMDIFDE